jgi:methylase of polypeptide subunit release factors
VQEKREPGKEELLKTARARGSSKRNSWPAKGPADPEKDAQQKWALQETLVRLGMNVTAERSIVNVLGKDFNASSRVFSPKFSLEDTEIFARNIPVKAGEKMLEIGTGTGILSIIACYRGASEIVAVDINWKAVRNAQANIMLHNMRSRISVRTGDVYGPIKPDEKFDTIFWNVPFVFAKSSDIKRELEQLQSESGSDPEMKAALERLPHELQHMDIKGGKGWYYLWAAYIDKDYDSIRKFIHGAKKYLKPDGKLLVCFSSTYGDLELLQHLAEKDSLESKIIFECKNSRGVSLEIIQMQPLK